MPRGPMRTSENGIYALASFEGVVPAPYLDSRGIWTFGIGHTASAGEPIPGKMTKGNPFDMDAALRQAFAVFRTDLARYEADVNAAVKVEIAQHEFDALVSFHFNTGGIGRAKLTEALNRGDEAGAANGFMGWLKPLEIKGRREAEQRMFRSGVYPTAPVPVYRVTESGRPGAVVRTLTAADVRDYLQPPQPPATTWAALERRVAALEAKLAAAGI